MGPHQKTADLRSVAIGIAGSGTVGTIALEEAFVARLAQFGEAAPLSLGELGSAPRLATSWIGAIAFRCERQDVASLALAFA